LQRPGSTDFHHTITVKQFRATVDLHIHYSFKPEDGPDQRTRVNRWPVLDVAMPFVVRPPSGLIT
jgi:hypothetical protein